MNRHPSPDAQEMKRALDTFYPNDEVIEMRVLHKKRKRTDAGYYDKDHFDDLVKEATRLNKQGASIYTNLNPLDPQLLGRYSNRLQEYAQATATDSNVTKRNFLLVDVDPVRPKDTAATDNQLEAAKDVARKIFELTKALKWPEPFVCESGNGIHLIYRVDLPNDNASKDLIKGVLDTLADRFDTDAVTVDRSVFNAARIFKLPGTVSTKGDHTPITPWRQSKILRVPEKVEIVSADQIKMLVPEKETAKREATQTHSAFNLDDFLSRLGIDYTSDNHDSRERYKLDRCPFNPDHGKGEAAIFRDTAGVLGFKCLHNSCADKSWRDVRELVDGPQSQRINRQTLSALNTLNAPEESEKIPWPILTDTALPGIAGEFVRAACKDSEADPAAVLATFLTMFAVQCGNSAHIMVGETSHPPRINSVIVGDTSKARKGTSAGPVNAIFKDSADLCSTSPGPLSSGEGIIYRVRDEIETYITDKKTGQGRYEVIDPGVTDKRLFVLDEEFASALQSTKRDGNTLSATIRTLYDSGDAEPLTKSNRIKATGAHVGIVTHITTGELKKLLTENEQINGFGNRFLWVCAKRQKIVPFPEPIPEDIKASIRKRVDAAIYEARQRDRVQLTDGARRLWIDSYHDLSEAIDGRAGAMVSRAEANVIRLALIYALLERHSEITEQDISAAMSFWDYCQASALYLFAGTAPVTKRRQKILELIPEEGISRTDLRRGLNNHIPAEVLDTLLDELEQSGRVITEKIPTSGAPKQIIRKSLCAKSAISAISPLNELNAQGDFEKTGSDDLPEFNF